MAWSGFECVLERRLADFLCRASDLLCVEFLAFFSERFMAFVSDCDATALM